MPINIQRIPAPIHLVLIDRDGVINQDLPTSVRSINEFHLLPRVPEAIRMLNAVKIPVVVVTNQALVGRGVIQDNDLQDIHQHMQKLLLQENAFLDDIIYCTDVTIEPNKRRKPAPGMLLEAMSRFGSHPQNTVMIGDALRDVQAAFAAECHPVLVRTGKGKETLEDSTLDQYQPLSVYDDLYEAVLELTQSLRI